MQIDIETSYEHQQDIDAILDHRYDQGWDFWTTSDKRLIKGAPFSALESALYLLELGVSPEEELMQKVAELFFESWREGKGFKVYPKGTVYPCQTAPVANLLVNLGFQDDIRIKSTIQQLLKTRHHDGGWRCEKFFFGRGPETEHSNPMPTLSALELLRKTEHLDDDSLNTAIDFLLSHWETKLPIGPCHYGIGSLFMQLEYPFRGYNLFQYVYTLSFYEHAKKDPRFREAFEALKSKTVDEQIVVERVVPKLGKLNFCQKNRISPTATLRYQEILQNLANK